MARLKHVTTGVVVNVDDEKLARLGSEWVAADSEQPKRASGRPRKADTKDESK